MSDRFFGGRRPTTPGKQIYPHKRGYNAAEPKAVIIYSTSTTSGPLLARQNNICRCWTTTVLQMAMKSNKARTNCTFFRSISACDKVSTVLNQSLGCYDFGILFQQEFRNTFEGVKKFCLTLVAELIPYSQLSPTTTVLCDHKLTCISIHPQLVNFRVYHKIIADKNVNICHPEVTHWAENLSPD